MLTYSKQIPIVATPDVLVCGAGLAGIGAAVAAARSGAKTLVVERNGFAGGFFTAIIGSAFDGFVDERTGTPAVGGIVFEMLERMGVIASGEGPHLRYNVNGDLSFVEMHPERVIPRCDPERFKTRRRFHSCRSRRRNSLPFTSGGCHGNGGSRHQRSCQ